LAALSSRISRVEAIPARVPFREKFVIGRGAVGAAGGFGEHVFVRLETSDGFVGWGEVRALPVWSYETLESITSTIRHYLADLVLNRSPFEIAPIHAAMYERVTPSVSHGHPFARAAMDMALHDLAGRVAGLPLHALLGGKLRDTVPLTCALSIDSPESMAAGATRWPQYTSLKVKIAGDPQADAERVRAVAAARPDADLWLDANQSYNPARLRQLLERIRDVPRILCVEQPVRSIDWFGLRQARDLGTLPIAVDEGCFSSHDVARIARLEAADLVVLKVCKSGGLRECLRSAAVADANGLGLLGSGLTESGIGFAASVHCFSTLPLLLPPELNGPQLLGELWVTGIELEGGAARVPDGPGLGVEVQEAAIREHEIQLRR
jgi:muconate cycloisomerase